MASINSRRQPPQPPATRRNGTLQSCEACRKAKLRCDHVWPVCGRCLAKNLECFYHPAPMTKRGVQSRQSPVVGARRIDSQPSSNVSSPASTLGSGRFHATLDPPSALPGYLGSTSYSAVLTEHRSDIPFELDSSTESRPPTRSVEPDRLQSGLEVLRLLYELTICDSLIQKFYVRNFGAGAPRVLIDRIVRSIRQVFDNLDRNGIDTQLRDLANQIFQNSSRPLTTHGSMTVEEYFSSFTGHNSRWEALGNIFAVSGLSLMTTPDNDPDLVQATSDDTRAKDRLLAQVMDASDVCLSFCDQAVSANELLGFLQFSDVMLRTQQYGDSSYQAWRRLGDLSATVYAAGLHQENEPEDVCPYFLRQWRRSCFAHAFHADKSLATFVGRPPLINYRYCTLTPPLDLSDDILIKGGDALNRAISELDIAGWDTHASRHRVSTTRIRFLLAIFREQTLEIALGTCRQEDLIQKSSEILEAARATWEACPDHLRYDRHVNMDGDESFSLSFTLLMVYLDYLYTCFLLQRTLVKRTNTSQGALFDTSRELLSTAIKISAGRDPMLDFSRHYSWIILYYGLPSASVLILELLRQTQDAGPHTVILPRAELIRNLSVFISCLSWVARPSHGNYHMCKEAEKKLSHILDQILDPKPARAELFSDVTSGLDSFLNWYDHNNNWDFNSEYMSLRDGFSL